MTIPDYLPFLRHGTGETPKDGGCLVQVAGFLYDGHSWRDDVPCVHPALRAAGIRVNDSIGGEGRRRLALSAARIAGTNDVIAGWSEQDKRILNVRLAVWAARQVLHLVREKDREVAEAAIVAAETWASDPSDENKANAAAAYDAAYAAAYAAAAYADAAYAAYAAVGGVGGGAAAKVELYEGLIDEFDRLTGRTSQPMTPEQGEVICDLSDAMKTGAR